MANKNIVYTSEELQNYYSSCRSHWPEFYPSERWVFTKIAGRKRCLGEVLDVGCACGGLGAALCERFDLQSYTGVDINDAAIAWAQAERRLPIPASFRCGDIVDLAFDVSYDMVVSLGCADWNIDTEGIITSCWTPVKPGGYLVISLRLTPGPGINDLRRSFQYINFSGTRRAPEVANYVVFNFRDTVGLLAGLRPAPAAMGAYGYWGKPSATAVTPFDKLVFAVFYLKKGPAEAAKATVGVDFRLPLDLFL